MSENSVTMAKMTKLVAEEPIELPEEFLEALKPDGKSHAVLILAPNTRIIRIIPTESPEVIKININIGKLSPDFLRKMGSIFIRLGIKTLYSTGLCFTQSACVYEGYIDSEELKEVSIDTIKDELERIEGVSSVEVEHLTV
ncbi:MAG: hypothetical protein K9W45_06415 [Candidatus Heimdallarchaeum aukensis]|uniref:Uncharacterized protein n=2 Tax=Candidatus Heimdallarchaeum TaxID=3053649 RepID=A0A9Y1BU46_9ARCH|nr:MAG: hypothetical protein K9W45_06415 [Candidatus Heimdallarchaeum aukensis]UJG44915.1 MAG: hypothetical protein K9W46_06970 [Candidatus Heimdallarchaeum endolithica]